MLGNQHARLVERVRLKHGEYEERNAIESDGCALQPLRKNGSTEQLVGGELVTTRWQFFGPPDLPTESRNVVEIAGLKLNVEGDLQVFTDKRGRARYVHGFLKRWEG